MSRLIPPIGPDDHVLGKRTAPVILAEYGDYECPHCKRADTIVRAILVEIGLTVRYAFRHFPVQEAHPHAVLAAQAAEAAGAQGRFFAMHHLLFENQGALAMDDLAGYADDLAFDVPRFVRELEEGTHLAKVERDFRSGLRSGVEGTPTFFIGERRWEQGFDYDTLKSGLVRAIRATGETPHAHR